MNKIIVPGTIIIIILMIGIPTYINVRKDHEQKMTSVVNKRIIEATKKCYLDGKCDTNYITLQDLYDKGYLKKQTDPLTKKYYDPESKIIKENEKITLTLS